MKIEITPKALSYLKKTHQKEIVIYMLAVFSWGPTRFEPRVAKVTKPLDSERFESLNDGEIVIFYDKKILRSKSTFKIDYSPSLKNITIEEMLR